MSALGESERALVSRFLDEELSGDELAAFERRMLCEPALREAVEAQREVVDWFARVRAAEPPARSRAGFVDGVLREARRLPSRVALTGEAGVPGEVQLRERSALRTGRALLAAAALILVFALAVAAGLVRPSDSGRLEAMEQRIGEIDRGIAEDARRLEELQPR